MNGSKATADSSQPFFLIQIVSPSLHFTPSVFCGNSVESAANDRCSCRWEITLHTGISRILFWNLFRAAGGKERKRDIDNERLKGKVLCLDGYPVPHEGSFSFFTSSSADVQKREKVPRILWMHNSTWWSMENLTRDVYNIKERLIHSHHVEWYQIRLSFPLISIMITCFDKTRIRDSTGEWTMLRKT